MGHVWPIIRRAVFWVWIAFIGHLFVSQYFLFDKIRLRNEQKHAYDTRMCKLGKSGDEHMTELGSDHMATFGEACDRVRVGVSWKDAMHETLGKTYVCGKQPCREILFSFTSSWKNLAGFALYILATPWVAWQMFMTAKDSAKVYTQRRLERKLNKREADMVFIPEIVTGK